MLRLFFGVVLSTFVLLQAVHTDYYSEKDGTEHAESDKEDDSQVVHSLPQIPSSSPHINLAFDSYLLDEVTYSEEKDEKFSSSELVLPRVNNAIRILLRKIVSPNAP